MMFPAIVPMILAFNQLINTNNATGDNNPANSNTNSQMKYHRSSNDVAYNSNETRERRKEILKAVTKAAGKYTDNNTGKVRLENETILIVGKTPCLK